MTVAIDERTRRRGKLNGRGKRAQDRRIVQIATSRGRGFAHIAPNIDNRHLIERFASWIYICIERNATEVAQHPIRLYSESKHTTHPTKALSNKQHEHLKTVVPQRATREAVEVEEHPFLDLMEYVNPILDSCGLYWLTVAYLQADGNAYWHIAENALGTPVEIWPLPSQFMFPILGEENVIDFYELRYLTNVTRFPAREVIHFRQPSPLDMISGFGNLKGILFAAETNLRMQEWENALFTNYCLPDFIFSPKGDISETQQKQLQADWENEFGGWRNRGKMAVSPFEAKIERLSLTAKELQFKEGRKAVLEEIAAGFGVPMNVITNDSITFNNMRHGTALWMRSRIKPLQKTISNALNTYLMPRYTGGDGTEVIGVLRRRSPLFVAFDNPVPEDIDADADRLVKLSGGIPLLEPNEARAELGRPPVEWGNEPFIPGGVRRPSEPIAGAHFPDGGGVDGQQPIGEDGELTIDPNDNLSELMLALSRAVDLNDKQIVDGLRAKIGALIGVTVTPVDDLKPSTTITSGIINPDQAHLDIVEDIVDGNGPGTATGATETGTSEGKQEQEKEGKAEDPDGGRSKKPKPAKSGDVRGLREDGDDPGDGRKDDGAGGKTGEHRWQDYELAKAIVEIEGKFGAENTDPDRKDQAFLGKLKHLLEAFEQTVRTKLTELGELPDAAKRKLLSLLYDRDEWVQKFADEAQPFTVRAFERGEQLGAIDLGNAGVAFEVGEISPERVEEQVKRLTREFASTVVDVTGDDVYKAISEGLRAEENAEGIGKRIAAVYGEKRDNAAERIARTELNRALNAGAQETWKAARVTKNEWLASVDACEFCTAMNGRRVPVGQPFLKAGHTVRGADGGSYTAKYGDVLHPTLHPFCTCTIVPVVEA